MLTTMFKFFPQPQTYQLFACLATVSSWITYWTIYSGIALFESCFEWLISWLPLYPLAKLSFVAWLVLPRFQGAAYLYERLVNPYFLEYEDVLDEHIAVAQLESRKHVWTFAVYLVSEGSKLAGEKTMKAVLLFLHVTGISSSSSLSSSAHRNGGVIDGPSAMEATVADVASAVGRAVESNLARTSAQVTPPLVLAAATAPLPQCEGDVTPTPTLVTPAAAAEKKAGGVAARGEPGSCNDDGDDVGDDDVGDDVGDDDVRNQTSRSGARGVEDNDDDDDECSEQATQEEETQGGGDDCGQEEGVLGEEEGEFLEDFLATMSDGVYLNVSTTSSAAVVSNASGDGGGSLSDNSSSSSSSAGRTGGSGASTDLPRLRIVTLSQDRWRLLWTNLRDLRLTRTHTNRSLASTLHLCVVSSVYSPRPLCVCLDVVTSNQPNLLLPTSAAVAASPHVSAPPGARSSITSVSFEAQDSEVHDVLLTGLSLLVKEARAQAKRVLSSVALLRRSLALRGSFDRLLLLSSGGRSRNPRSIAL